jgi:hypothetical protein
MAPPLEEVCTCRQGCVMSFFTPVESLPDCETNRMSPGWTVNVLLVLEATPLTVTLIGSAVPAVGLPMAPTWTVICWTSGRPFEAPR